MASRFRLKRLARISPKPDLASLEDGTVVEIAPGERLAALLAALDDEHHPLHDPLPRLAPGADPRLLELRDMIAAILGADDEVVGEGEEVGPVPEDLSEP